MLSWIHPGRASAVVPGHVLIFPERGGIIDAVVTASCSSILSVLGLTALTAVILRGRKLHALGGLLLAVAALLVLNHLRLLLSALAGIWWGDGALVLFHDWVGTLWNLVATLGGFLLMVWCALPALERAEQDVDGRHTARRPDSWARPGLGYRAPEGEARRARRSRGPRSPACCTATCTRPGCRGAWPPAGRPGASTTASVTSRWRPASRASARWSRTVSARTRPRCVAVATYDEEPLVLDALAQAVAARQWEPVTSHRVAALRLWAHGWLLARGPDDEPDGPWRDADADEVHVLDRTAPPPGRDGRPHGGAPAAVRAPAGDGSHPRPRQLSFARPHAPPTTPGDAP